MEPLLEEALAQAKEKRLRMRAYLVSFFFAPFGLAYALYFAFTRAKPGRMRAAGICVALTVGSFAFVALTMYLMLTVFITPEQKALLQQLRPEDIKEYQQFLLE